MLDGVQKPPKCWSHRMVFLCHACAQGFPTSWLLCIVSIADTKVMENNKDMPLTIYDNVRLLVGARVILSEPLISRIADTDSLVTVLSGACCVVSGVIGGGKTTLGYEITPLDLPVDPIPICEFDIPSGEWPFAVMIAMPG